MADLPQAQALLDEQARHPYATTRGEVAASANPALKSIVGDYGIGDLRGLLFTGTAADAQENRRRSGQVARKLHLLRAHGLIQKVPRTHRYMLTDKGRQAIGALHAAREADIKKLMAAA